MFLFDDMRNEYDEAYGKCDDRSDEYCPCSNVFGVPGIGVFVRGGEVDIDLYCGIESLCGDDHAGSHDEEYPFDLRDLEIPREAKREHKSNEMDPGIVCAFNEDHNASPCMSEALCAPNDRETLFF